MKAKFLAALAVGALTASAIGVRAANDQFTFPAAFAEGVEYLSVDKPSKQVHVFYAPQSAIDAAKAGKPMPEGTVFVGVHYNAKLDKDGNPEKDANGRFIKADLRQFAVMRKEKGWGGEYPADKPLTPADITKTVYHAMGIENLEATDGQGRPYNLLAEGNAIEELF